MFSNHTLLIVGSTQPKSGKSQAFFKPKLQQMVVIVVLIQAKQGVKPVIFLSTNHQPQQSLMMLLKAIQNSRKEVLTAIVLVTELNLPVTPSQFSQVLLTSMYRNFVVQISPLPFNIQLAFVLPPPPIIDGRPDDRTPGGTRATKIKERI